MPTNDLSNNKIPVPPPPPPEDWGKNRKPAKNNDKNENTLDSTPSKTSNSTQLKRGLSEVSNPNFLEELKNNSKFKEANNANGETADEGSKNSIHVKNPETRNSAQSKEEDNASDKTKNDRSNTKQVVPKKPMTEQHNSVHSDSENQKSSVAEQKKATGLKYSIAILLLCTSSTVAGVYTYFIISAVLSSAAVPVSSAVIAFVSALVMLSLAAYLINSHLSAINSEKGVDPGRKQSQDLQKAKELEHSNTPIPSLEMSGTPSAPPPPLTPVKSNDLSTTQRVIRKSSPSDANQKDVQQKQFNTSVDARSNLLAEIRKGLTLKKVSDEQKKNYLPEDGKQESDVQSRNKGVHQIRKVENQKTDKEPNNSESMQQMDSLTKTILEQRTRSGFQDKELDSLEERDDSLCSLEGSLIEPNNTSNKELKNPVQRLNASIAFQNIMFSTNSLLNSPSNNLLSNSGNVPDDEDWETQPQSIPYIYCDRTRQERRKEKGASPSTTKGSGADQVSNEVKESSTVSVKEKIKNLQVLNK